MVIELKEKMEWVTKAESADVSSAWKVIQAAHPPPKPAAPKRGRSFEDILNLIAPPIPERQDRHHRRASGHLHELGPPIPLTNNARHRPTYTNMSLAEIHRLHAEEDALLSDDLAEVRRLRAINQRTRIVLAAIADADNETGPGSSTPPPDLPVRNRRDRLSSITENRIQGLGPALERGMELADPTIGTRAAAQASASIGNRSNPSRGAGRPNVLATRQARGRERGGTRDTPLVLSDSD